MKAFLKLFLVFVVFVFVAFPSASVFAEQKLMPLEEVQKLIDFSRNKAVDAHFDTVLRGTKIESLEIIIRGVVRQPGLEVILFTSKSPIAAGMSGSPAYVNGKLIGAVAYSLNGFSKEYWGGISPISLMMTDVEVDNQNNNLNRSFDHDGKIFVPIALGFDSISTTGSFSGQKFTRISDSNEYEPNLGKLTVKPGMPIVVDLVKWTDEKGKTSSLGATGKITYVDDDGRVFAFGHPFLNSKKVVYAFRTAEIIDTIFSDDPRYNYKLTGRTSDVLG